MHDDSVSININQRCSDFNSSISEGCGRSRGPGLDDVGLVTCKSVEDAVESDGRSVRRD